MTNYWSNLPVELIHKILDDITAFDILGSLCLVNKRLRLICLAYAGFQVDLSYIKKNKQFDLFCNQLATISSQIVSLSFLDQNDTTMPCKIDRFFSQFTVLNDTFSNLNSLHLSHVDDIMWKSIRHHIKSLRSLTSLLIDVAYMLFNEEIEKFPSYLLKDVLFISASLKNISVKFNDTSVHIRRLDIRQGEISSIEHLTLLGISIALEQLYPIAPALRSLKANVMVYNLFHKLRSNPFQNLRRLSVIIYRLNFSTTEQLLHPMTRLDHLIIVTHDVHHDMSDGTAWERILTKITSFKFLFMFHKSTWIKEPIKLDSFRSLFWLKKKQWYVGYDRCTVSGFSLLYSIPYFKNNYPWCHMKGDIQTKSTKRQILSLNKMNCFTIDKQLSIKNEHLYRLTNLQQLSIHDSELSFHVLFYNIVSYIDLSKITTLFIGERRLNINNDIFVQFVYAMSHLRSLSAPLVLIKLLFGSKWSSIRRLRILLSWPTATNTEKGLTSNEIDAFYRSFIHIEYFSFHQDVDLNTSILLNNTPKTVSNLVIHHPCGIIPDSFHDFVTYEWLEQNTRLCNFLYSCNKLNVVSLWF